MGTTLFRAVIPMKSNKIRLAAVILLAVALAVCLLVLGVMLAKRRTPVPPPDDSSGEDGELTLYSGPAGSLKGTDLTVYDALCLYDCKEPEALCPQGYSVLADSASGAAVFYRDRLVPYLSRTLSLSDDGTRGGVYALFQDGGKWLAVFSFCLGAESGSSTFEALGHRLLCYRDYFPVFLGGDLTEWETTASETILSACGLKQTSAGYTANLTPVPSSGSVKTANSERGLRYDRTNPPRSFDPMQKRIALTYDDGPNGAYTPAILDALEKHNAKATFFVMGSHVADNAALIQRAFSLGCEIGNHTNLHEKFSQNPLSIVRQTIETTSEAVRKYLKIGTAIVRPPAGETRDRDGKTVTIGYPIVLWSVDTLDYTAGQTGESVLASALTGIADGDIVLMHDIHAPAADAAEPLIAALLEQGYQLVTVSELLEFSADGAKADQIYTKITPLDR